MAHSVTCVNCGDYVSRDGECADTRCPGEDGVASCHFCSEPIFARQYDGVEAWEGPADVDDPEVVDAHAGCVPEGWSAS